MAKAMIREDEEKTSESIPEVSPVSEPVIEDGGITIEKYFQLYASGIHEYTRAYIETRFCGILKSKGSWDIATKAFMEGEK